MKGEEVSQVLPDDLVEKILARVPFPHIWKVPCLSKSWLARFSSTSQMQGRRRRRVDASLDDAGKKLLATSFQKQVGERSRTWKSFFPACIAKGKSGTYLFGYDSASQRWQELPSLSFLPENFLRRTYLEMEGPLLYALPLLGSPFYLPSLAQCYVANIFTQTWKEVSLHPNIGLCNIYFQKLVSHPSSESYKLIKFCRSCGLHIYDSKLSAWNSQQLPFHVNINSIHGSSTYLNGILYICSYHRLENLLAYNVEDGTCEVFNIYTFECSGITLDMIWTPFSHLVVCSGNLLMVQITTGDHLLATVLKIDLHSRSLFKVACGPPDPPTVSTFRRSFGSDGNSIFFRIDTGCIEIEVSYNLDTDKWTTFPVPSVFKVKRSGEIRKARGMAKVWKWIKQPKKVETALHVWGTCFQTGLKPFVEV